MNSFLKCAVGYTFQKRHAFSRIVDLSAEKVGDVTLSIKGWVKSIRKLKNVFFLDINDGSCSTSLQVVVNKSNIFPNISYGSSVLASGKLSVNPNQNLELIAEKCEIIGGCNVEEYPFRPKKSYSNEYIRQYLHFRFRTNRFSSLSRVRHCVNYAVHDYFLKTGFLNVHTPILTSNDCEGAGEVFNVIPESEDILESIGSSKLPKEEIFFDEKVYLTVSGQLHLEAAARGLGNVYTFGPTFRAENSKSRLHLSEFYMVEAESPFVASIEDITSITEQMIKHITNMTLNKAGEDVHICRKLFVESEDLKIEPLENILQEKFTLMSYNEASDLLLRNLDKFSTPFRKNSGFTKEQELFLVKNNAFKPIFVVDWPVELKPFYMKQHPLDCSKVSAFDLLCPVVGELCGGSLREDNFSKLENELNKRKLNDQLKWYLDLRKFGNVLTGGFGMGFERYLQVLLNINNIKDTIPFPRWPHNCKM